MNKTAKFSEYSIGRYHLTPVVKYFSEKCFKTNLTRHYFDSRWQQTPLEEDLIKQNTELSEQFPGTLLSHHLCKNTRFQQK